MLVGEWRGLSVTSLRARLRDNGCVQAEVDVSRVATTEKKSSKLGTFGASA